MKKRWLAVALAMAVVPEGVVNSSGYNAYSCSYYHQPALIQEDGELVRKDWHVRYSAGDGYNPKSYSRSFSSEQAARDWITGNCDPGRYPSGDGNI